MATQTANGKAFEWAVASAASRLTGAPITAGAAASTAEHSFDSLRPADQEDMTLAAGKGVDHLLRVEARKKGLPTFTSIELAVDAAGKEGDVRDVLLMSGTRTVGISCKNNHADFKHQRLSGKLDFIQKWGIDPTGCRPEYWEVAVPLFDELALIRDKSQKTARWEDLDDKADRFYWPLLDAWEREIRHFCMTPDSDAAEALFRYIVGNEDFYKVVRMKEGVYVQAFNFDGTLQAPVSGIPRRVVGVDRANGNAYSKTVRFEKGYVFNFRIHNASSRVEPSLKFAVSAIGLPAQHIYTNHILLDM